MNKKTSITVILVFVAIALVFGALLANKGDGPVMGMILADKALESSADYQTATEAQGSGIYLVVSNAFNKFQEDYKIGIPANQSLYATIHFVECSKGSVFTAKWLQDGAVIQEEDGVLQTDHEGVISYSLEAAKAVKGSYTFQLYSADKKILEKEFTID